jgi:HTH-type transcriptional regulator, sugar sensing transcriptional regulator
MSNIVDLLGQLGFSEYEAKAYITLLQQNPLNGYELAKASGIPRANIYGVLQRLEEHSAVLRIEDTGGVRYAPVTPDNLLPQIGSHFQQVLTDAKCALETIPVSTVQGLNRNVLGYDTLLDQARLLIGSAKKDLFIALWHSEAQALANEIAQVSCDVQLKMLCVQACPVECDACAGKIYRYRILPHYATRWLVVIADQRELLLGEVGQIQTVALHTTQQSLVQMTTQFLQSQIAWAVVLNQPHEVVEQALPAEAQRILREIQPADFQSGWLSYMQDVLNGSTS